MRQRRARTPSSNGGGSGNGAGVGQTSDTSQSSQTTNQQENLDKQHQQLPDLLPTTFHLAETSSLFSSISDKKSDTEILSTNERASESNESQLHKPKSKTIHTTSVVEVRESNTSELSKINNIHENKTEMVYTIQLESAAQFEPEQVETVMIYDVSGDTSDTDTSCPTPVFDERRGISKSMESIEDRDEDDEEVNAVLTRDKTTSSPIQVERQRISFEENRKSYEKDHDLLHDSEVSMRSSRKILKIRPSLRDILMSEERDSFYNSDKENYDEPIVFSEDEEIGVSEMTQEMSVDSDTDTVFNFYYIYKYISYITACL